MNFPLPLREGVRGRGKFWNEVERFYFDHFTAHAPRGKLFPSALEVLKTAKRMGIKIYVFSTVRQSILLEICKSLRITSYFDTIAGGILDKEKLLKIFLKTHRINPKDTLFIGDTDHDITAARKNGLKAGAMLCGYQSTDRLLKHAPDFVWNDHRGLLKFLRCIERNGKGVGGGGGGPPPRGRRSTAGEIAGRPYPFPRGTETIRWSARPTERVWPPVPIPTVGALIFNKGDIFLVQTHKWGHTFGIPGGKIKKGETMEEALRREIHEETGMKIKNIRFAMAQDSIHSKEFYRPNQHFLLLNFYADSPSRHFKLNDEAESGIWVHPKTALKLNLNQPTRKLLGLPIF